MAHALLPLFPGGVLSTSVNLDTFGHVWTGMWTGKFDLNSLRVDRNIFESGKKELRNSKVSRYVWPGPQLTSLPTFSMYMNHSPTFQAACCRVNSRDRRCC